MFTHCNKNSKKTNQIRISPLSCRRGEFVRNAIQGTSLRAHLFPHTRQRIERAVDEADPADGGLRVLCGEERHEADGEEERGRSCECRRGASTSTQVRAIDHNLFTISSFFL